MTANPPAPFEVFEPGVYLHGTKAVLAPGDLLVPGHVSNYVEDRALRHVYLTETLDAATWGAELAQGDGPGFIYVVEPTGELEDDPNVTDKRFPGNPTCSYRTLDPVRVIRELEGWIGHDAEVIRAMRQGIANLSREDGAEILD